MFENSGSIVFSADHGNSAASSDFVFKSDGAQERMRINSSGTLLIGQTVGTIFNQSSETGLSAAGSGSLQVTGAAATVGYFNRLSSDGQILGFYKNGGAVGGIITSGGTTVYAGNSHGIMLNGATAVPSLSLIHISEPTRPY